MNSDFNILQSAARELARNPYFVEIDKIRNKFNVFLATDMQNREVKHTKFLSYLLDPNESHGLGDDFLTRFLQRLPISADSEIDLLDLHISYTRVVAEESLKNEEIETNKKTGQIDLIIEIPSIAQPNKSHILVIENKHKSKQGEQQLKRYRSLADKQYGESSASISYYYLTISDEAPDDEKWISVLYSDAVIPALEDLIKYSSETISDYLIKILNDYIELLTLDDESEADCENLATKIDHDLLKTFDLVSSFGKSNPLPSEYVRLATKYPRAIQFLKDYEKDPRVQIGFAFSNLFGNKRDGQLFFEAENPKLYYESSTLKYLRFGFLTGDIAKKFQMLSEQAKQDWLKGSRRHLALEFVVINSEAGSGKFDLYLKLVLGPFGESYRKYRQVIFDCIYQTILHEKNTKSVEMTNHSSVPLKGYKLKDQPLANATKWLESTLTELSNSPIIQELNAGLSKRLSEIGEF